MKVKFSEKLRLNKSNKKKLVYINEIIEDYRRQGYVLTLRQLYYQLVSRDVIPNKQREYAKLSNLLKKGRMAGVVDWEAIEDRLRKPFLPYWAHDVPDAISDILNSYRVNRQKGQEVYVELWVEKDALPPQVLNELVKKEVEAIIDMDLFNEMLAQENEDKDKLEEIKDGVVDGSI